MEGKVSLGVVIPSARYSVDFLDQLLELRYPTFLTVRYRIIIDSLISDADFPKLSNVVFHRNSENIGAPLSRNKGLDLSKEDWILFLDDDILPDENLLWNYAHFIRENDDQYIGAVGLVSLPAAQDSFTRGIRASDILTFFEIATWYDSLLWGVTANVLVKRTAVGDNRFSKSFPKRGGGEDIDFFLRCVSNTSKKFKCLPDAKVCHNWWPEGRNNYLRFFRWAYGDSALPQLHPEHRYRNWPNASELFFIWLLLLPFVISLKPVFLFFPISLLLGEIVGEYIKLMVVKKVLNPFTALESSMVRASNDIGRISGNLSRGNWSFIGERFDYFCDGKHINHERLWATFKLISIAVCTTLIILIHESIIKKGSGFI